MEEKKTIFTNTSLNRIFQLRFAGKIPLGLADDQYCQSETVLRLTEAITTYRNTIQHTFISGMEDFACTQDYIIIDKDTLPWINKDFIEQFAEDLEIATDGIEPYCDDNYALVLPWPTCSENKVTKALMSYMKDYINTVPKDDKTLDATVKLGAEFVVLATEINNTILNVQETVMYEYLSTLIKIRNRTKDWLSDNIPHGISSRLAPNASVKDIANIAIGFIREQDNRWKNVPKICSSLIAKDTIDKFYENIKKAAEILYRLMALTGNKIIPKKLSRMLTGWMKYTFNLGKENNDIIEQADGHKIKMPAASAILMRSAGYAVMSHGTSKLISNAVSVAMYVLYKSSIEFSGSFAIYDDYNSSTPDSDYLDNIGIKDREFSRLSIHAFDRYLAHDLFEIQVARSHNAELVNNRIFDGDGMVSPFVTGKYTTSYIDSVSSGRLFVATLDGTEALQECSLICNDLIYSEDDDKKDQVVHMSENKYKKAIRNEIKARKECDPAERSNAVDGEDRKEDGHVNDSTYEHPFSVAEDINCMGKNENE